MEVRAKLPKGLGTWPAFWMMPTNSVYGGWPNSGEIDIMEHYGCDDDHIHSTVHNNMYNWNGGIPPTSYSAYTNATSDFHIYEVEWNDDELNFYLDGEFLGTYFKTNSGWQQWPYDQDFYIILNLAIGSHFMPCATENNLFPEKLEVDYIRVYQLGTGCGLEGDINQDTSVNVTDVVLLVSYVLSQDIDFSNCNDLNNDNQINITDIVYLINLIINPTGTL
jgi:beta-glucanase (GH16 family)